MIILPLSINVFYQASALTMRRVLSLEYLSFLSTILFGSLSKTWPDHRKGVPGCEIRLLPINETVTVRKSSRT